MPANGVVEGRVVQVAGPTIEIEFPEGHVPKIYNAIHVTSEGYDVPTKIDITAEVAQHIGEGRVRTIAMEPTDGLVRGMKAFDLGATDHHSGRQADAGPRAERAWAAGRQHGPDRYG